MNGKTQALPVVILDEFACAEVHESTPLGVLGVCAAMPDRQNHYLLHTPPREIDPSAVPAGEVAGAVLTIEDSLARAHAALFAGRAQSSVQSTIDAVRFAVGLPRSSAVRECTGELCDPRRRNPS